MKLLLSIIFILFASISFLSGQENLRNGTQLMMDGIIQHRRAKEACESSDYITAHQLYDEALNTFIKAKKALDKDKAGKQKAIQQIALIRKEKESCKPLSKNANPIEPGAKILSVSGLVLQKSSGTGGVVGHIANMTISNYSDKEMTLCFSNEGACPPNVINVGMIYVEDQKFQDYVLFGPLDFVIPAHSTFIVPVTGVCVQPDKDPVPDAVAFSKPSNWILANESDTKFTLNGVRNADAALYIANIKHVWPEIPASKSNAIIVESGKNTKLTAALVFHAIQKIDSTIIYLEQKGLFQRTLFDSNQVSDANLLKLYSTWYYVGILTGNHYTYEDFERGIFEQLNPAQPLDNDARMSLTGESKKFWEQVMIIIQSSGLVTGHVKGTNSATQEIRQN